MDSPEVLHHNPSPRLSATSSPRFTEHFNSTPPYQQYPTPDREHVRAPSYASQATTMQHRISNKDHPMSPSEISSPFPEAYQRDMSEKEVVVPPPLPPPPQNYKSPSEIRPPPKRICGIRRRWFILIIVLLLVIAIALGVGLGVGLSLDSDSDSKSQTSSNITDHAIGGAIDPKYFSKQGVFNGSGIALASQSFARELSDGSQGSLVMYFQHWTGQIRYKQLSPSGEWLGGDISEVVAVGAKNGTPLSAVSYVLDEASTWHVFYIDNNNTLRQRSNSNKTNVWVDGPINALKIKTYDADMVGMQACWYGSDYGDVDYTHTPLPNENANTSATSKDYGMHLWYASDETTFKQLGWREGQTSWAHQQDWPNMNGHAGVGCYSWGPGTTTYVMFVNLQNTVEFWWKDTNTNLTGTESHPINVWTNSSISIPNVHPSTSLGYTNIFYAQSASTHLFTGYNISWAAENTSLIAPSFDVGDQPGLPGTHLSVSALPDRSGGDDLVVFYQIEGDEVREFTRDLVAGVWSEVGIEIPN
ncbi:hypothetical protein TI39_contig5841g00003 [Zymoseptoria brevis]|uniref:Uncharacterized protein n=1 Tax=Zymoseptoria brevis TaxID=1047168 RepID=A0A0F4G699_9PEZI|nr:hypothetical protein TI39_contig5841g00003 [Zymoseptoria brevis]